MRQTWNVAGRGCAARGWAWLVAGLVGLAPLPGQAAIISVDDLERSVVSGETFSIAGLPNFTFQNLGTQVKFLAVDPVDHFGVYYQDTSFFVGEGVSVGAGDDGYRPTYRGFHNLDGGSFSMTGTDQGYVGFSFLSGGGTHYGWVELTVQANTTTDPYRLIVHGYGFEDSAGVSIVTGATGATRVPEPGSLALAAAGGLAALGAGRRRRRAAA
jgi:hypothetical protein